MSLSYYTYYEFNTSILFSEKIKGSGKLYENSKAISYISGVFVFIIIPVSFFENLVDIIDSKFLIGIICWLYIGILVKTFEHYDKTLFNIRYLFKDSKTKAMLRLLGETNIITSKTSKRSFRKKILKLEKDEFQSPDEYDVLLYKMFIKKSKKNIKRYASLKITTDVYESVVYNDLRIIEKSLEKLIEKKAISTKKADKLLEKLHSKKNNLN
ncbi:hypothetical protein LB456_05935 [Psychroflexus sp. CAK57W]|uniref:hypothetical protein n=1 Tax=Psychroflexus curvus TaxID=2873595 RepID=UPI001CC96F75|nr:hypothetical protein [Psychroflexus curvus]MBZ9786994.1 hypothetical protein [Psychroflexus curvus]